MNYIVVAYKTTNGSTACATPTSYSTENSALAQYHTLCATAASGSTGIDTVLLLREDGSKVKRACFVH